MSKDSISNSYPTLPPPLLPGNFLSNEHGDNPNELALPFTPSIVFDFVNGKCT
jgi:hypothetical protein